MVASVSMTPLTSLLFSSDCSAIWLMSSDFVMGFGISFPPDSGSSDNICKSSLRLVHDGDVNRFVGLNAAKKLKKSITSEPRAAFNGPTRRHDKAWHSTPST